MEKGKFGVTLSFYGVTAFVLAALGLFTPLVLLTGVVLFAEKNEWAVRQTLQACCVCMVSDLINNILNALDVFYRIPILGSIWSGAIGIATGVVSLLALVLAIIGIVRNARGKEADIPLAARFANWAYGKVAVTTTTYKQAAPQSAQAQQAAPQNAQAQQAAAQNGEVPVNGQSQQ